MLNEVKTPAEVAAELTNGAAAQLSAIASMGETLRFIETYAERRKFWLADFGEEPPSDSAVAYVNGDKVFVAVVNGRITFFPWAEPSPFAAPESASPLAAATAGEDYLSRLYREACGAVLLNTLAACTLPLSLFGRLARGYAGSHQENTAEAA